ncbi:hypothetical protein D3C83_183100 [compost metagenome]
MHFRLHLVVECFGRKLDDLLVMGGQLSRQWVHHHVLFFYAEREFLHFAYFFFAAALPP